eukprot:m.56690 g.56690  ORF g.56690 m.56690 type:complete len:54 (-) comp48973_c1_seq4:292-453(-)
MEGLKEPQSPVTVRERVMTPEPQRVLHAPKGPQLAHCFGTPDPVHEPEVRELL